MMRRRPEFACLLNSTTLPSFRRLGASRLRAFDTSLLVVGQFRCRRVGSSTIELRKFSSSVAVPCHPAFGLVLFFAIVVWFKLWVLPQIERRRLAAQTRTQMLLLAPLTPQRCPSSAGAPNPLPG